MDFDLPRTAYTRICKDESGHMVVLYSHARLDELDLVLALYLLSIFTTEGRHTERFKLDDICAYMTEVMTGMTDMLEDLTGNRNLVTESLKAIAGSLDGRIETLCILESLQCLASMRAIYEPEGPGTRRDYPVVTACEYEPSTNQIALTLHDDFLHLVDALFRRTLAQFPETETQPDEPVAVF